jgi:hypothetical protein
MLSKFLMITKWRPLTILGLLGSVSWLAYFVIVLCAQSLHEEGSGKHSLLFLLALFGLAYGCYLVAIRVALQAPQGYALLTSIVVFAFGIRATLLLSDPIEEIDLYRYLWDGEACVCGVNPFRYTPQQVLAASTTDDLPADLARLVARRDSSPVIQTILKHVHFGELPTIYPPVSQVAFAVATIVTPRTSSVSRRMMIMKSLFVVCDLITGALVFWLLKRTSRPIGWLLAYAWCPLLLKEVANSGHLDALAVMLTTAAACLALKSLDRLRHRNHAIFLAVASASCLAFAVGAKLYPVILAPWLILRFARYLGWRVSVIPAFAFCLITAIVTYPMWPDTTRNSSAHVTKEENASVAILPLDAAPLPPPEVTTDPRDPSESLRAFLTQWEMNDFIFLLVIENLRPTRELPPAQVAWFSIVPESWRGALLNTVSEILTIDSDLLPFLVTRSLLSIVFLVMAGRWAWPTKKTDHPDRWLEAGFLTLVWFWLLLPTVNPWYLTWALPFLPFCQNRAWLVLPGLAFFYYLRFWLTQHFTEPMFGTGYTGATFFDFIVTWIEFVPWLVWLGIKGLRTNSQD